MGPYFSRQDSKNSVWTNPSSGVSRRGSLVVCLDQQTRLTVNQWRFIAAAVPGDMLEFFDYFVVGFVLASVVGPWHLSFGQSAVILLSSGVGVMGGANVGSAGARYFSQSSLIFRWLAVRLVFTSDHGWVYRTVFRFIVGSRVGGLYWVDLPLTHEFVPASRGGMVGGLVTAAVPVGCCSNR